MKRASLVMVIALLAFAAELSDRGPLFLGGGVSHAVVGRPLTPMSYAGVARRTTRRAAYAGAYAGSHGGYYGGAYPVAAAPITTLPGGCVGSGGIYTCGSARYRAYYDGPTVVYRVY